MATYQGAEFLESQLQSLTDQTLLPDELVVVDDGSTDSTHEILRAFSRQAPFPVRLVLRTDHLGTGPTFTEAMLTADADILFICDQDDVWMPEKLAVVVERMADRPDALMAFSDAVLIDATDQRIGGSRWRVAGFGPRQQERMRSDPLSVLLSRQVVSGCTAAIRRELLECIVPLPSGVHSALGDMMYDRWISLVAGAVAPVLPIPERLVSYRIHAGQQVGIPALGLRRLAPQLALKAGQFLPGRSERIGRFDYHVAHMAEVTKRLESTDMDTGDSHLRLRLASQHLQARGELTRSSRRRIAPIARHYRDEDGYRRFALGLSSAVSDWTR